MEKEKACIFNVQRFSIHDGPGIRTTVFFKGCPLRCPWCSNPESQSLVPEIMWDNVKKKNVTVGQFLSQAEVMDTILKDSEYYAASGGGVTLSGGEVLCQSTYARSLLEACRMHGIHTACETTGFSSPEAFREVVEAADLLLMDLKHYDCRMHQNATNASLEIILSNLRQAYDMKKEILIRIPIIPGFNSAVQDAVKFGTLLAEYKISRVELLPFHQLGKNKYHSLSRDYSYDTVSQLDASDVEPLADIIRSYGINCSVN